MSRRHRTFERVAEVASSMLESLMSLWGPGKMSHTDWHHKLYDQFCLTDARRLSETLRPLGHQRMVIGFDACRHLNVAYTYNRVLPCSKMSLVALQRVIQAADCRGEEIQGFTFWYTFLDGNPSIFDLIPRGGMDAPSHQLGHTLRPVAAWPFLGFDQMVPKSFESRTPQNATDIRRLMQYGRPVCVYTHDAILASLHDSSSSGQQKHFTASD
jgi:hypothetical protein